MRPGKKKKAAPKVKAVETDKGWDLVKDGVVLGVVRADKSDKEAVKQGKAAVKVAIANIEGK